MSSPRRVCSEPGCPAFAVDRGRCRLHRLTDAQRGYGREHRADRAANRLDASCEACGCTANLQRDHRIPRSMGGGEEPANKRWLCACPEHGCHARVGLKTHAGGRFVRGSHGTGPSVRSSHIRGSVQTIRMGAGVLGARIASRLDPSPLPRAR